MSGANLGEIFVMLCDWRGHCVWTSSQEVRLRIGDCIWDNLAPPSQRTTKTALASVVALRERTRIEVTNNLGARYNVWMWPLESPEVAVCLLVMIVPRCLESLTRRELDMLELLASGTETREIARQSGLSVSTVHTHMRRAREKLKLRSVESLISFAARYCFPADRALGEVSHSLDSVKPGNPSQPSRRKSRQSI